MLRRSKNGLWKSMLTVKKIRLQEGSAELVEFDLTSCQEGDLSLVNEGIVNLADDDQEQFSVTADSNLQVRRLTWRKTLRQSILSNNCNLLLKVLLLLQFVNSFYLRHLSKDSSLKQLVLRPFFCPLEFTGISILTFGRNWLFLKVISYCSVLLFMGLSAVFRHFCINCNGV